MTDESPFSERLGYVPQEILFRDDLSDELRQPILDILRRFTSTQFLVERVERLFNPYGRDALPRRAASASLSEEERRADFGAVKNVLLACDWFRLYDLVEDIYQQLKFHDEELADVDDEPRAHPFAQEINRYFRHSGIGWQLIDGRMVTRGAEAFESVVKSATTALVQSNRPTAAKHIQDALLALSRRPTADSAGAIYHAVGALEGIARDLTGNTKATLGEILKRHPELLPRPLDEALSKMWGYASDEARHVVEGRNPSATKAELIVGLAAAIATYLVHESRSRPL